MLYVAYFVLGVWFCLTAQNVVRVYRRSRKSPPTKEEIEYLLAALSVWAEKYHLARPKKKNYKRREGELFEACAKIGLMWLEPFREGGK